MASSIAHVVMVDTRTPTGVAQLVDTMWIHVGESRARVREINDHPARFPNMVAWVKPYRVIGGRLTESSAARASRGEDHGSARLTDEIVRDTRIRNNSGESVRYLATLYGVSPEAMSNALKGRTWAHVV